MKSRYIKRRKKFHYIIISVTIIVCLLGTVFTSLAILDSSRDLLIANAVNELNTKMDYIKNGIVTSPNNSYNEYVALINENVDKGNTYFQLTYDNDMTITTDNVLTVHYNDINGGILDMGTENYIRFDVLKNLLSDDEYKEICNYLNTPADKDGNYYLLICKKFYGSAKYGYVPSQLEIVKSNKENDWYVQDESIKKYSFDLKKYNYLTKEELKSQQFENDEMHRNIIDKDFFLGKSKPKYSQKDVEKILSDNSLFTDIYDETGAVPDGIFKYYVLLGDCLYYTENHMINNSPNEYKEVTRVFHITSLKEINLLDDCLWKFITVFAVAFTIMAVVITVEIFSWKDFKRRTAQEETRLEMTNAIAHNLKTPLFVIGGFAENLKNEEDTEKKLHNIEIIQQQTEEMDILIHRMLDLSRFDSPALKLNCEVFDFKPFLRKFLKIIMFTQNTKLFSFTTQRQKLRLTLPCLKRCLKILLTMPKNIPITVRISQLMFRMMCCQSAINARHLTGKISQNCGSLISEPQREIIRVAAE